MSLQRGISNQNLYYRNNLKTLIRSTIFFVLTSNFALSTINTWAEPSDVWSQSFIAKYYNKHCSQDLTGLKTIIVQQLCYNTQYGM